MPAPNRPNLKLDSSRLYDALILGAGPAGLSAALALSRVNRTAAVFSTPNFRNDSAIRAHTILTRDHTPPSEIRRLGREEIERYGTVRFVERAIKSAWKSVPTGSSQGGSNAKEHFEVEDETGEIWRSKKPVLALGVRDVLPTNISGYAENWGSNIYQCLFCDGIEKSNMPAGVLGFESPMYLHNVSIINQLGCPSVTILGNGPLKIKDGETAKALETAKRLGAKIDERKIQKLVNLGHEKGLNVVFEDGSTLSLGFIAHKPETVVNAPHIAEQLGVEIISDGQGGTMLKRTEPFGESNVPGVFVSGDAGTPLKQVTKAMYDGVCAGGGINIQLCTEDEVVQEGPEVAKRAENAGGEVAAGLVPQVSNPADDGSLKQVPTGADGGMWKH